MARSNHTKPSARTPVLAGQFWNHFHRKNRSVVACNLMHPFGIRREKGGKSMRAEHNVGIDKLGIASLLGFVITQAFRDVYLGHLFGDLGLYEVATLAFGTAAVVFGIGLFLFKRDQIRLLLSAWPTVLALNITTTISWLSYFQALRMVEPAAVNLAFCGVAPVAVALFGAMGLTSRGEHQPSPVERAVHLGLLGSVVILAAIVAGGYSGFARVNPVVGLAGVALAAFAGFSITAETIFAKRMNLTGVSSIAIVGIRFMLVTVIAAAAMLTTVDAPYAGMSPDAIVWQAVIFLAILIGPIYLVQAGIALTTPLVSGVICSIGPVATLILQSTVGGVSFSPAVLAITLVYAALSIAASVLTMTDARRQTFA